ncbi:hypothetical protein DFH07DRAFT_219933 [Mycena maculata]|uniref:C2H2-type domain-containing protein n=1 Tax=Mycena maculata TaxID=230809 RepID=A0AAD7HWM6_9AGAR|nr:hypothetical protein DFH07DRAFT_219933 [Mycena maculata]
MSRPTWSYDVRPDFPDDVVKRYPSLTLALGNNYPRLWATTVANAEHEYDSDHGPPTSSSLPTSTPAPLSFRPSIPSTFVPIPCPSTISDMNHILPMETTSTSCYGISSTCRNPLPLCQDSPSNNLGELGIAPDLESTPSAFENNLIPICSHTKHGFPPQQSAAASFVPVVAPRRKKGSQTRECDRCGMIFPRPCDLRTHQKVHIGERPFTCDFLNCQKKFGVRANLQRHTAMHKHPRKGVDNPNPRYVVNFECAQQARAVPSDSVPMRCGVVWDYEGPLAKRRALSPPSVETVPTICGISSLLRIPQKHNRSYDYP